MTLRVALVEPEGEVWSGEAEMVIARTLDGEIGLLTGHAPIIGILAEGSMVQIRAENSSGDVFAAVTGGFLSVADNHVSILARQGQLGSDVDVTTAQAALDRAVEAAGPAAGGPEEPADVRYYRSLLQAADQSSSRAAGDKRECQAS
jgi:F-type H+-transporting ATPase subunit epsilon